MNVDFEHSPGVEEVKKIPHLALWFEILGETEMQIILHSTSRCPGASQVQREGSGFRSHRKNKNNEQQRHKCNKCLFLQFLVFLPVKPCLWLRISNAVVEDRPKFRELYDA